MTVDGTVIAAGIGSITTLLMGVFAAISYVYRDSLRRSDAYMEAMAERYDHLLQHMAATLTQVATSQGSLVEIVKALQKDIDAQQFESEVARRLSAQQSHSGGTP